MAEQEPTHLSTTEARGGTRSRMTRYVLVVSLVLVIVAFAIIVASGWMS